jgi:conjugative transfer region protein (TIGR03748 family)
MNMLPRRQILALTLGLSALATSACAVAASEGIQVGRYTSVDPVPDTRTTDPLEAIVTLHFPRRTVRTVGDALAYFVPRAGYRLTQSTLDNPTVAELLVQALPESHRTLGPMSVRTAVQTLVGPAFVLQEDRALRRLALTPPVATAQR